MTVSPASEIQFWRTGEEVSFNNENEGYTDDYKFYQKFICDAERKFQGYGTEDLNYRLSILECGEEVETIDYTRTAVGGSAGSDEVVEPIVLPDPNMWTSRNISPSLINWGVAGSWATLNFGSVAPSDETSEQLYTDYAFVIGHIYNITVYVHRGFAGSAASTIREASLIIGDSGFNAVFTETVNPIDGISDYSINIEFTATEQCTRIILQVREAQDGAGGGLFPTARFESSEGTDTTPVVPAVPPTYYLYTIEFTPDDLDLCDKFLSFKIYKTDAPEAEEWYSDEVEFVSEWLNSPSSGRINIKYKSTQNFAELIYSEDSEYFSIDLEGRFRKEKKVTTQKTLELTDIVLNTASSLKVLRKLTADDLPDYMHTKVNLILAHASSGSVVINGKEWSVEEGYEEGTRPETYPLTPAEIFLTEKDAYYHNVI